MAMQRGSAILFVTAVVVVGALIWGGAGPADVAADKSLVYAVREGTVSIDFDPWALDHLGWSFNARGSEKDIPEAERVTFPIQTLTTLAVEASKDSTRRVITGIARTRGALLLTGAGRRAVIGNLAVGPTADGTWTVTNTISEPNDHHVVFELLSVMTHFSAADSDLRVIGELSVAESWAKRLGVPEAAGAVIGKVTIEARLVAPVSATPVERVKRSDDAACTSGDSSEQGRVAGEIGSDVIIAELQSVARHGRVGDITAYSVGTDACNIGDERASWIMLTNRHPLIFSSMYRLKDGRFEEIGMSWVKHGFYAVSQSLCGPCNDPTDGSQLGIGCSDPYSSFLNGVQSNMSLRSDVNAHTGYFPYPPTAPVAVEIIDKRLQIHDADLDFTLNEGALYFIQGHYIHPDDADAGTHNNNASYRSVVVLDDQYSPGIGIYHVKQTGHTQRQQSGIRAWHDTDSSITETDIQVPGEGLFILAAKATNLGNGFWHYEYALQNLNSDRSAGSFSVPLPNGALVQNIGFHDVDYHSGEIYDLTDWPAHVGDTEIVWATDSYDIDPNANALRFSTLYNFRFDANVGPGPAVVTIGLFKPGLPEQMEPRTIGPSLNIIDCNDNGIEDACDVECGEGCEEPCGGSDDCNENGVPDECEQDCNGNGIADECDIANCPPGELWCADCNGNLAPDECDPDCDGDGIPDDCDTWDDTDGDGIYDCFDLCPYTTPENACVCPPFGRCCFDNGICIEGYSRTACIEAGGTPDCMETPCRDGCLIGDFDSDGDRDLRDCLDFWICYSGSLGKPGYFTPSIECLLRFDFDDDDDIDLFDYEEFQAVAAGP